MDIHEAQTLYRCLMAYIASRNASSRPSDWCKQLRIDEATALRGELADVVDAMRQAQTDYAAAHPAHPFPYNSAMGEFLGLPIRSNGEPEHGYYMAGRLAVYDALGRAQRVATSLIAEGKELRIVTARSTKGGKPVPFARFFGLAQIEVRGDEVHLNNGKLRMRLSSNWSRETCLERVIEAMRTGHPYGEPC